MSAGCDLFFFFNLQLVWPPHFLACSTAPAVITYAHLELELLYTLGPYLVIISFSSTARILLKLPLGKPLFTLRMLRRTRDTKTVIIFVDERYNATMRYILPGELLFSLANYCSASCNRALSTSSKQAFS